MVDEGKDLWNAEFSGANRQRLTNRKNVANGIQPNSTGLLVPPVRHGGQTRKKKKSLDLQSHQIDGLSSTNLSITPFRLAFLHRAMRFCTMC